MLGEKKLEEVFRKFVTEVNSRNGLCLENLTECPELVPPIEEINKLLIKYIHLLSLEVPQLVINEEVEIDVVGDTGEKFYHMFESEGMLVWICDT